MNPTLPSLTPPLVLIADDDPFIRMQLRLCLEKDGFQVETVTNGQEALERYLSLAPDIVLLDAVMSTMSGFECCLQLQSLPQGRQTPILMITGLEDQESVDRAFAVGATDYVTKPIHWAVLRQRVRRLIHQARLQQQLAAANQELHRLVMVDALTGVANRRCFDDSLEREWKRMARSEVDRLDEAAIPLSLLLCDVDYFKLYNDTYGHPAGDRCLQHVARAIVDSIRRPADLVARYGGEEFAVLLPNTNQAGASHIAAMICQQIRSAGLLHRVSPSGYVTLSIGVATLNSTQDTSPDGLIMWADQSLYRAKQNGRDRYEISSPEIVAVDSSG